MNTLYLCRTKGRAEYSKKLILKHNDEVTTCNNAIACVASWNVFDALIQSFPLYGKRYQLKCNVINPSVLILFTNLEVLIFSL